MDPGNERGEMATVNPVRVTGASLGRTDANKECPSQSARRANTGNQAYVPKVCPGTEENWR